MLKHRKATWLPIFGLICAMLIWGSSFIAMKFALSSYDPLVIIFGRMFLASLVFLLFRGRFGKCQYRKGDWKYLAGMALCEPCLYFLFEVHALELTSASQAGVITALLPLMTAVAARQVLAEKLSGKTLAGFALALAGVVGLSVSGRPTASSPNPLLGNFLEFMAMVCAVGYTLGSRYLSTRYSAFFITAFQSFVGSVFFAPALLLPSTRLPTEWVWGTSLAILYLGAVVSVVAYFLYNYGLSRIPAGQASSFVNLIPVFSVFLGWLLLDERLTPLQYGSIVLVIAGTCASQYLFQSQSRATQSPKDGLSLATVE